MATTTMVEETAELSPVHYGIAKSNDPTGSPEQEPSKKLSKDVLLKLIGSGLSFYVAGVNDGSFGALVPYLLRSYGVSTAIISVVYGTNFAGWFLVALFNTHLCQYFDLGAMLLLGAGMQLLAHALRTWAPPFPLFALTFFFASLGQAFQDTHANTFVSSINKTAHRWLGFIHAMYMAGCLTGPLVATAVASADAKWNLFYIFPLGLSVVNFAWVAVSFWDSVALRSKTPESTHADATPSRQPPQETESRSQGAIKIIKSTLAIPSVWLLSLFFFFYLGAAITAGVKERFPAGWVVEYLVAIRKGDLHRMGYVSAGFSGGGLVGRLLLAEPTHRWGERKMLSIYCVLCIGFQLMFWLVPNIVAASVAISLVGVFSGPLFAAGVSVGSRILPPDVKSTALSFVFVLGQLGGSIFPIVTGVIASRVGVQVLQPILVGIFAATLVSWLLVPNRRPSGVHED